MKRRSFLKSLAATALMPAIPFPALPSGAALASAPVVPVGTYKWAETIVRAHNNCNLAMLQRHLRIDAATASALQSQLVKNGIIGAQANAYGMHKAVKPLLDSAFLKPANPLPDVKEVLEKVIDNMGEDEADEVPEAETLEPSVEPELEQEEGNASDCEPLLGQLEATPESEEVQPFGK